MSQSTQNALKRVKLQKIFLSHLTHYENFQKIKSVSQSTGNARVKMQKFFFTPFDPSRASRKFTKILEKKKSVSQSTQNALKRIEMQNIFFTPLTHYALCA